MWTELEQRSTRLPYASIRLPYASIRPPLHIWDLTAFQDLRVCLYPNGSYVANI